MVICTASLAVLVRSCLRQSAFDGARQPMVGSVLVAGLLALALGVPIAATGQTPVVLPNVITTVAGGAPIATTVGGVCAGNPQFTATDVNGNGCPANNAVFAGNERSMTVDPEGNVYVIADSSNPQAVRRIDARTGNITIFAGAGSGGSCSGAGLNLYGTTYVQTDKVGDNCAGALTGGFNGARGLGSDFYGNIIIGVTGDNALHFVCTTVSPLCSAAQARINYMRNVAGCTPSVSGYGTAVVGTTVGTAGDGGPATQFSGTCTVGTSAAGRASVGDRWGNIYFSDNGNLRYRVVLGVASITVNGVAVPNPLYAAMALYTATLSGSPSPTAGNIYPIAGGGMACSAKLDTVGDGCPFYQTTVSTSSTAIQGVAVDFDGNFYFTDGLGHLRVIYMAGTNVKAALAANGVSSPVVGSSYALIGPPSTYSGSVLNLYYNSALTGTFPGSTSMLQSGAIQRIALDSAGNVYIGDQSQVLFYDIYTGSVRRLGGGTGAFAASCNATSNGDGCPIAQSLLGAANLVTSVAVSNIGDLYIQDLQRKTVRRVSAATLPTTPVNSSISAPLVVHAPAAGSTVSITATPSAEYTVGTATCAAANADGSVDCTAPVTFVPTLLAQQNDPITIATTVSSTTTTNNTVLNANATGSALVFDTSGTPATNVLGTSATGNTAVVLDGNGNSYVSGTQGISKISSGGAVTNISATAAKYIAVDPQGNVYATNGSTSTITKYVYSAGTYTATTITIPTLAIAGAQTQGNSGPLAVDANGVIYIADLVSQQVIKFSQSAGIGQQLTQIALTAPTALSQDTYGNLLVIDGTNVLKVPSAGIATTASSPVVTPTITFPTALVAPTAVVADQGENIYVADSGNIIALSFSGSQYTIPGVAGSGVAVDGAGNLYVTKSSVAGVTQVLRNAETHAFGTDVVTPYVGVFLNAGATAATGFSQTDTGGNFSFLAPASPLATTAGTCNLASTALAAGGICNTSIKFAPTATGSGNVPDAITLLPAANTIGSVQISGIKNGSTATTTTAITGNTTGLIYSPSTETTFTVTVTQSSGTPAGTIAVSFDGGTATNYTLVAATASTATASVPVAGLTATAHTISATYGGSSGIAGSTSPTVNFSIGQASTVTTWTPATTTQQFSAAVGSNVLNATAANGATSIPGVFVYTATPTGGAAMEIHSASFLPIGTYSLNATFYPTDAVDYTGSTASVATYTVTKASTTAAVGATQMLVAADGTGNYTTVQAAINALSANGGSVYIKPGTYNGFISVVQPNVAIRGLGGDPTQVVLTHSAGAFSVNPGSVYNYTGEFTAANSNGAQMPAGSSLFSGDEGSATMVVAKGINSAVSSTQLNPNNFYGENFTLANTYDSDTTTTTTTYVSNGVCTANAGPPQTYNYLFNNGIECASQALAIWITSDLAVMNNVYTTSLQDTIYAGSQGSGSSGFVPARNLWFRGKVTGTVDYIFGDAAAVFDHSSIYTLPHGNGVSGTATIEAQNKANKTGGPGDYLSGYIMNSDVFTSYTTGMTGMVFGRPYGTYSTYIMLNNYVDQIAPAGYIEFSGQTNLPTSTYSEYNNLLYTDPATGNPDLNGVVYTGLGGNTGTGVNGTRETVSLDPGTPQAANAIKTSLTQPQAQQYYTNNFLGSTVTNSSTAVTNWNATAALASYANGFVPTGSSATVVAGSSVTILIRPQTPGLGAVTNGVYTIPTGTYTLTDTFNNTPTVLASGSLDASGEAFYTSSTLPVGTHNLKWTYSGDSNFSGSTTGTAYALTVTGISTSTALSATTNPITYGQAATIQATVSPASGTAAPTGSVTITIDGSTTQTASLANGIATFTVGGLQAGNHSFSASYAGGGNFNGSSSAANLALAVNPATLTVTGACANRIFDQINSCSASVSGYQYGDTAATVFATTPTGTTSAVRTSPAGPYTATPLAASITLTGYGSANYTVTSASSSFTVAGGAPQSIIFATLPGFAHGGSYQLTARTTSGLPVTYTVTSGGSVASVSGSTLTVTGIGTNVTIQASTPADPTGDYAPATPVSMSFTPQ